VGRPIGLARLLRMALRGEPMRFGAAGFGLALSAV